MSFRLGLFVAAMSLALPFSQARKLPDLVADPDFVIKAMNRGLDPEKFSDENYAELYKQIESHLSGLDEDSEIGFIEDQIDVLDDLVDILGDNEDSELADKSMAYFSAFRAVYGLSAEYEAQFGKKKRVWGRLRFTAKVPYYSEEEAAENIGAKRAKLEATDLLPVDGDRSSFLSKEELAKMSTLEISELDISDKHPAWFSKNNKNPEFQKEIEKWREKSTKKKLRKKLARKKGVEASSLRLPHYDLETARKVVFIDEVKTTATSAKINVRDNYGVKWKLKWGAEIHTEPISNCLYLKAGAKYADLAFSNPAGKSGVTLVLDNPLDPNRIKDLKAFKKAMKAAKKNSDLPQPPITSVEEFKAALWVAYKIDMDPHIQDHGVLTFQNAHVLANIDQDGEYTEKTTQDLWGRKFITFKSSLMEIKDNAKMTRIGPGAYSHLGATKDRVARGSLIFNQWIWNPDTKDDNNRVAIVKGLHGDGPVVVDFQHDLGVSLGHLHEKGNPNSLEHDRRFMRLKREGLVSKIWKNVSGKKNRRPTGSKYVVFDQFTYFQNYAFDQTTFADARWMAKQIGDISNSDINSCVNKADLPDFMKSAITDKLILRRNLIADFFHVDLPEESYSSPVNEIRVPLETPMQRVKAATRYGIKLQDLEVEMRRLNLLDDEGISSHKEDALYTSFDNRDGNTVGKVAKCNDTVLMGLLVEKRHPSGLTRRQHTMNDNKGLKRCELGGRRPSAMPWYLALTKALGVN